MKYLSYILIPIGIAFVYSIADKENKVALNDRYEDVFIMRLPKIYGWTGVICSLFFIALFILMIIFPNDTANIWVGVIFIAFTVMGLILLNSCLKWRIFVYENHIVYITMFGHAYKYEYSEITSMIDKIKNTFNDFDELGDKALSQCSKELQKDIADKEDIYREYLGENFTGFKLVNLNVLNQIEAYNADRNNNDWNNTRDKMIYENFQTLDKELPKGKYYGQWGLNHTFQSKEKDIMWFAAYLNGEDSIYKDKILTVIYNYDDCEQMGELGDGRCNTNKLNIIYPQMKETNDLLGGNLNIYKLTGENSPFSETPMYYSLDGKELDENMLEFFQYIICIKNSKRTEPLNDEYN